MWSVTFYMAPKILVNLATLVHFWNECTPYFSGTGLDPGSVLVQKTAYCDAHTPGGLVDPDSRPRGSAPSASKQGTAPSGTGGAGETAREESRQKMKKARRLLAKKRSSVPVISIPTIPPDRYGNCLALKPSICHIHSVYLHILSLWFLVTVVSVICIYSRTPI